MALKSGFYHSDGDGGHQSVANVVWFVVFAEMFFYCFGDMLFKCALVCASLGGVLSVDIGIVFFAVLVGVGECDVDAVAFYVYDVVEGRGGHVVVEQVFETVATGNASVVVVYCEAGVEIGVVSQHKLYIFCSKSEVSELLWVRLEIDVRPVFFCSLSIIVADEFPILKCGFVVLAVAVAARHKFLA